MTEESQTGYKKPPKSTRFKAGQSGNKRGRPKGSRNLKTDLSKLMTKRIAVREDGEVRQVTGQEAMLLGLFEKALRGDSKASAQLFGMLMKFEVNEKTSPAVVAVTENDRAIVEDFLRRNMTLDKTEGKS